MTDIIIVTKIDTVCDFYWEEETEEDVMTKYPLTWRFLEPAEPNEEDTIDVGIMKELTGNDYIEAKKLFVPEIHKQSSVLNYGLFQPNSYLWNTDFDGDEMNLHKSQGSNNKVYNVLVPSAIEEPIGMASLD